MMGAHHAGGVGGDIGDAETRAEDHDLPLRQVLRGRAEIVLLREGVHRDRGHERDGGSRLFHGVLEAEAVDHGAEHAHLIGSRPAHAFSVRAAPDIPRSDDDADLDAFLRHPRDDPRDLGDLLRVEDGSVFLVRERFAGELQQHPIEPEFTLCHNDLRFFFGLNLLYMIRGKM